jgi:hypothetical protein
VIDIFRTGHDIWGRPVLQGVAWDLVWVALAVGAAVIVGHAIWRAVRRGGRGGA